MWKKMRAAIVSAAITASAVIVAGQVRSETTLLKIVSSACILAEPPVAVLDTNVEKHGEGISCVRSDQCSVGAVNNGRA